MQHLEREQALAKQFAEILHFTLSFDELKVDGVPVLFVAGQRIKGFSNPGKGSPIDILNAFFVFTDDKSRHSERL